MQRAKTNRLLLSILLLFGLSGINAAAQCPGMCIECKTDALSVCGGGCVASMSCSNKDCSCSYTCRAGCHPGGPVGIALKENIFGFNSPAANDTSEYSSAPTVNLRVVAQSAVPLTVSEVAIRNEPGRELSQVTFKVHNQSNAPLREVSLMLVFLSPSGEPLGGETFCQHIDLKPNAEQSVTVPLKHYVESGQHVWIAVRRFKTDAQSWTGDGDEIVANIKRHEPPLTN